MSNGWLRLGVMRGCLALVAWILLLALLAQFFQAAPWLLLVFAIGLALAFVVNRQRKAALEQGTKEILGDQPLGNILDANRSLTASSARMLVGDSSFDFEVVGESFYAQNFLAIQKDLELEDGEDWDAEAALVADPGNQHSNTAVAVFVSGLKVGYVPETMAARIYSFLMQHGGYARADAAIYFSSEDAKNSIWLDLSLPPNFRSE